MKILNWAAGISALVILILCSIAVYMGSANAYALGYKYGKVLLACIIIIVVWWFVRKNTR